MAASIDLIKEFLDGPMRNNWLYADDLEVYVRKSKRLHPAPTLTKGICGCFDIANIKVYIPGEKTFSKLIEDLKPILIERGFDAIYIESVLNPFLRSYLQRLDSIEIVDGVCANFYLLLDSHL